MHKKIIVTTGLALFAMFFGAGNIVYPLQLGAQAGGNIFYVMAAFLIAGIGLPFLGLYSTSLYQGNYWDFFSRLGKFPAFLLITFLVLIIGPLFATPRTETVTYHTLAPFLPFGLSNEYLFSGLYCTIIFLLTYRQSSIVDIIGRVLSPIKIGLFALLIIVGLFTSHNIVESNTPAFEAFKSGISDGYGTMDLLAAFFFCAVAYRSVAAKTKASGITDKRVIIQLFSRACILGAIILGLVYSGFMFIAFFHSQSLQNIDIVQMISAISQVVLGKWGSLFVCLCVSFACIATATALTEVTTNFLHEQVCRQKVSRIYCLLVSLVVIYFMSIQGFAGIMKIALPILEVLYPLLIVYCVINIFLKFNEWKKAAVLPLESAA